MIFVLKDLIVDTPNRVCRSPLRRRYDRSFQNINCIMVLLDLRLDRERVILAVHLVSFTQELATVTDFPICH